MLTKTITTDSVLKFFLNYKGHSFIGLTTLTDARLLKTGNPFGRVFKKARFLANIGFHYSNSLDNQAKREGKNIDFQVKPRQWGKRLPNSPLVVHTNKKNETKYYLECKREETYEENYFLENGAPIEKSAIQDFFKKSYSSSTQSELDKKIILNDILLDNILSMRINGENVILD